MQFGFVCSYVRYRKARNSQKSKIHGFLKVALVSSYSKLNFCEIIFIYVKFNLQLAIVS